MIKSGISDKTIEEQCGKIGEKGIVSEKIENPTEHMAKTRLLILNSGKIDVSNKYSFLEDGWYPIGGLLIDILKTVLFIEDSIIS